MVEAAGIDGDLVPITDHNGSIKHMVRAMFRIGLSLLSARMNPRAERLTEPAAQSFCKTLL